MDRYEAVNPDDAERLRMAAQVAQYDKLLEGEESFERLAVREEVDAAGQSLIKREQF